MKYQKLEQNICIHTVSGGHEEICLSLDETDIFLGKFTRIQENIFENEDSSWKVYQKSKIK